MNESKAAQIKEKIDRISALEKEVSELKSEVVAEWGDERPPQFCIDEEVGFDQSIPDREDGDGQIGEAEMGTIALSVIEYVRSKTGFVDEAFFALSLAIGGLCAMKESFGKCDKEETRNRAREVLDTVLGWDLRAMSGDETRVLHGEEAVRFVEKNGG